MNYTLLFILGAYLAMTPANRIRSDLSRATDFATKLFITVGEIVWDLVIPESFCGFLSAASITVLCFIAIVLGAYFIL